MTGAKHRKTTRKGAGALALLLAVPLFMSPRPAFAQFFCEPFFVPMFAEVILEEVQDYAVRQILFPPSGLFPDLVLEPATTEVQSMLAGNDQLDSPIPLPVRGEVGSALKDFISILPRLADVNFNYGGLGYMDITMRKRLDDFWHDLRNALAAMTTQIYSSGINTARLIASINDAGGISTGALGHQDMEIDAKLQHVVSDESCQFDTVATNLGVARAVSTAVTNAYADEFNAIGNGRVGTPGQSGGSFRNMRFQLYKNKFCDIYSNGGAAPCSLAARQEEPETASSSLIKSAGAQSTPAQPAQPNAAVTPGKTIFAQDTIDMSDPDTREAARELIFNITGYEPPPLIPAKALESAPGREQMLMNREYLTQMDVVSSLAWGVIADRAPSAASTQVQQMRQKAGQPNASLNPSERETIQAIVDNLSKPEYYVNLGDSGGTITQKEVYLKAYNAMLLYKLIEKQEKISAAYAVETANMVKKYKDRGSQRKEVK